MEWNVKNAVNRDVERQHLNKILKEIRAAIDSSSGSALTEEEVRAIVQSIVSELPSPTIRDFNINLIGDVEGSGTVEQLTDVTIDTTLSGDFVEEAPVDSNVYWRGSGAWQPVPGTLRQLGTVEGDGALFHSEEDGWTVAALDDTPEVELHYTATPSPLIYAVLDLMKLPEVVL